MRVLSSQPGARGRWLTATVAFTLGLVLTVAWTQERGRRETSKGRRADLGSLVAVRQTRLDALERELSRLRGDLRALTVRSGDRGLRTLKLELDRLRLAAGLAAVEGPGIAIELADSPLAKRGDPGSTDFQIQDVDLQGVVNELWADGAEAIAINGQRIVATTAIRSAGGAVLVNYRVLTSPYSVAAIGDGRGLRRSFEASEIARRFRRWAEVYRLGFRLREIGHLFIPAFGGGLTFRYARTASREEG